MEYTAPVVEDLGDLCELTQSTGTIGSEDGVGKTVQVDAPGVAELSVGVFP